MMDLGVPRSSSDDDETAEHTSLLSSRDHTPVSGARAARGAVSWDIQLLEPEPELQLPLDHAGSADHAEDELLRATPAADSNSASAGALVFWVALHFGSLLYMVTYDDSWLRQAWSAGRYLATGIYAALFSATVGLFSAMYGSDPVRTRTLWVSWPV